MNGIYLRYKALSSVVKYTSLVEEEVQATTLETHCNTTTNERR